jgi:hypothetical protein
MNFGFCRMRGIFNRGRVSFWGGTLICAAGCCDRCGTRSIGLTWVTGYISGGELQFWYVSADIWYTGSQVIGWFKKSGKFDGALGSLQCLWVSKDTVVKTKRYFDGCLPISRSLSAALYSVRYRIRMCTVQKCPPGSAVGWSCSRSALWHCEVVSGIQNVSSLVTLG